MLKRTFLWVFLCMLMSFSSVAQTRKQLEKQRKEIQKEIKKVNTLLFKTKKEKSSALDDLKDLNQKIEVQERLIKAINLEAKALSKEITLNEKEITKLNKKLSALKADYAAMIFKSYKSKSQQSRVMFLLSSANFNQAYKRLQYMKQYTLYRKKQGEELKIQTKIVESLNDSLLHKKKLKDALILSEEKQQKEVKSDKKKQERLVSKIKKKEKSYKKDLRKKIKAEQRLEKRIDNLIKAEIRRRNALLAKKNKTKIKKKSSKFILSPEAKALATKFEQNKGKLPRPINKGLIVRKFGQQKHPTIPGIMINSTGIHIATEKGSDAKSVFNGEVMAIMEQSEGKKAIMVKHGNYISVYKNLEIVYVQKGDKVTTGEQLGKIFTNKSDGKTTLIFVLLRNTTRLNPSHWIL